MARRSASPPPRQPAVLSAGQIKAAIPKLEWRLRELEQVDINAWNDDVRNSLDALQSKVEDTLVDVFGPDTLEYKRFKVPEFWYKVSLSMGGTPGYEYVEGYGQAVAEAITKLGTAIELLQEKLQDMGETPEGQALHGYQGLDLHPEIDRAAGALYRNRHFANAIEDAVKALTGC